MFKPHPQRDHRQRRTQDGWALTPLGKDLIAAFRGEHDHRDALRDIAAREKKSLNDLIAAIDSARDGNLSSAIRIYVLRELQK